MIKLKASDVYSIDPESAIIDLDSSLSNTDSDTASSSPTTNTTFHSPYTTSLPPSANTQTAVSTSPSSSTTNTDYLSSPATPSPIFNHINHQSTSNITVALNTPQTTTTTTTTNTSTNTNTSRINTKKFKKLMSNFDPMNSTPPGSTSKSDKSYTSWIRKL